MTYTVLADCTLVTPEFEIELFEGQGVDLDLDEETEAGCVAAGMLEVLDEIAES